MWLMSSDQEFRALVERVKAGDDDAAAELVRRYERQVRRMVRLHLTDPRLNRVLDSVDVCQSVLANFFVRAAAGQFDLNTPEELLRLLGGMARHRVLDHVRKERAARRDRRRLAPEGAEALEEVAAPQDTPSQIVAGRELLQEARRHLSPEERYLADQRALGREWADIAAEVGGSAEALRKQLTRALDRVTRRLGLDGTDHE
jgi:RNA polymerase sigma-70 factor (ECF subfamily)